MKAIVERAKILRSTAGFSGSEAFLVFHHTISKSIRISVMAFVNAFGKLTVKRT